MTFLYYKRQEPTFSIGNSWKMQFARTRRSDILFHALTKTVIVILRSKEVISPFRYFLGQNILGFFPLLSEVLMVEEAFLQQLKVYPLLCTWEGLPPASAGDTLPPAVWLVPEGASPPEFLCFFFLI